MSKYPYLGFPLHVASFKSVNIEDELWLELGIENRKEIRKVLSSGYCNTRYLVCSAYTVNEYSAVQYSTLQ
jgi:hypothetical protein